MPEIENEQKQFEVTLMEVSKVVDKDVLLQILDKIRMDKMEFVAQVGEDITPESIVEVILGYLESSSEISFSELFAGEPIHSDIEEDVLDLDDEQRLELFRKYLKNIGFFKKTDNLH